jgi:hypothetical protein
LLAIRQSIDAADDGSSHTARCACDEGAPTFERQSVHSVVFLVEGRGRPSLDDHAVLWAASSNLNMFMRSQVTRAPFGSRLPAGN